MESRFNQIALSLLIVFAISCGKNTGNHRGKGHQEEPTLDATPPPNQDVETDDPKVQSEPPSPTPAASEFDVSSWRSQSLHYYQWDARLTDLFSPKNATSQLCWPAAIAEEFEYRRTRIDTPLRALPPIATGTDKEAKEMRFFTTLCETDKDEGTTVIKGVRCIDKHLKASGLTPDIHVSGVDAQWQDFGFFPEGVTAPKGPLELGKLKQALLDKSSVLMLIGFYTQDPRTGVLKRERGHFVGVTGFGAKTAWADDRISLRIMNPAVEPLPSSSGGVYEGVELRKADSATNLPEDVIYELIGKGFSDGAHRTYVESSISF